jgi:hypothetical protein
MIGLDIRYRCTVHPCKEILSETKSHNKHFNSESLETYW